VLKVIGIGCLVIILVPGLLGVGLWQVLRASGGLEGLISKGGGKAIELVVTEATSVMLQEMKIPESDRTAILNSLDGLGDRIAHREISAEQVEDFVESLADGPLIGVLLAEGFSQSYFSSSGLSDVQIDDARLTVNRFQQGLINGTIEKEQVSGLKEYLLTEVSDDHYELKNSLSDADLISSLDIMKKAADDASIPMVSANIDIPDMFETAIDRALNK
jgi:hypothetical protein